MKRKIRIYEGPAAWQAEEFQGSDWIDVLTTTQKQELIDAARALPDDESQWLKMTREDLVLPTLGQRLDQVTKHLEEGRGFAVLRGIDLPPMDVDYAYRINWILALGLGNVIAQNTNGEVIGAVQAVVEASDNGLDNRGYVSNAELRFHCDGGDVASLLCVRQAPEGGFSSLVSMVSIQNAMARECPEHLATLYRGLHMFVRKEGDLDSKVLPRQPLFFPQEDHVLAWINLRLMELPYESSGKPMPANERAALIALEEIAERPEQKLTFKLQPGDMLLTHNYVCMHKRSNFIDDPDPDKSRLMLRLWYSVPNGRVEAIQPTDQRGGYFTQSPYSIRHREAVSF
ncbi:MAG: TauD/TfdA family dioxygenase [Pseudomonadales bacterium]